MLKELKVRDLALVAESNVRFGPGLNLLTGETGSGKSLIIDALSLALGARGGADQVRHGAERASIEADFDLVVLQREIGKRGAARVDGRPATPAQLREVGTNLVAIHGQHAHQALLDGDTQTELLDAYAAALEVRAAVATAHAAWVAAVSSLRDLDQLRSRGEREQEYLRWQLEELRKADLKPGEDEALGAERTATRHAARLAELGQQALDALREEGLTRAAVAIGSAASLDVRLAEQATRLERAVLATRPSGLITLLRALCRTTFLPPLSPVRLPARSGVTPPVLPGRWGYPVVLDRNHQDWPRDEFGRNESPRTVVPGTDVPATVGEHVVFAPVEKVVGAHAGSVHDRSSRNRHQQRGGRKIDPDIHTDLGMAQARQTE